jgi:hypothetical protein
MSEKRETTKYVREKLLLLLCPQDTPTPWTSMLLCDFLFGYFSLVGSTLT